MGANVLCERKEQLVLSDFFEEVSVLLKDSDDAAEKEKMKKALQNMTDTTTYMVLGEEATGKTSLLGEVFRDILEVQREMSGDICEYRWGEQEFVTPVSDGYQRVFLTAENMRGLSVIDTKGLDAMNEMALQRINNLAEGCSAIFVVLDAGKVGSIRLWDIIEKVPDKKMIFFLSKCDLLSDEELAGNLEKVKCYMKESAISAPIFPVSIHEQTKTKGTVPLEEIRCFIREQLVGSHPMLRKQMENVEEAKKFLVQLRDSFALRKEQYTSDAEILKKINLSMDNYVANHKKILENFIGKLEIEINHDIDSYEQEIISKIDPYKIKERFRNKTDFMDYLNMVNDNYKNMMTESVNSKTVQVIKSCLHDLEIIFQEAVGYFNTRENILELNDRFYGSLADSRKQMVAETKEAVVSTGEMYRTLRDASEMLFMQIWNERKKYDAKIRNRKVLSALGGSTAGTTLGVAGGIALGHLVGGGLGVALGILSGVALVGIGVICGVTAINAIAKNLYDPKAAEQMEEATQKSIEQFKEEVAHTRVIMMEQIRAQITEIFESELAAVDGCFTDFRISVNIDEKKIPVLEQNLLKTEALLKEIYRL